MLFILIRRLNLILILLCILYFSVLNMKHQINRWFSGLPLLSAPESFSRGMPVRGSSRFTVALTRVSQSHWSQLSSPPRPWLIWSNATSNPENTCLSVKVIQIRQSDPKACWVFSLHRWVSSLTPGRRSHSHISTLHHLRSWRIMLFKLSHDFYYHF